VHYIHVNNFVIRAAQRQTLAGTPGYSAQRMSLLNTGPHQALGSDAARETAAAAAVNQLAKAINDDVLPHGPTAQLFGMAPSIGYYVRFGAARPGVMEALGIADVPRHMPLASIVFGCWITLQQNGQFRPKEIVDALLQGSLTDWFDDRIRNSGAPLSYYSIALVDGDLLRAINWDYEAQAKLAADVVSGRRPFAMGWGQGRGEAALKSH
jgi:hypothetical protein